MPRSKEQQPLTISEGDIVSRVHAFEAGIRSIDPKGTRFPLIRQCLRRLPEDLDLHVLHREAVVLRRQLPLMEFGLRRGSTWFSPISVELGPLSVRPGSLGYVLLGPAGRYLLDRRVVPIQERVEAYLSRIIRST